MLRQRENSPMADDLPMSPITKRRSDFKIKQIQNGVMGRARSTLNTLGDVWRPKIVNTLPKQQNGVLSNTKVASTSPPQTPTARTLDFFSGWSTRNKKPANKKDVSNENLKHLTTLAKGLKVDIDTSLTKHQNNVLVDNSNKNRNSANDVRQQRHQQHNKKQREYSRNSSLDLELMLDDDALVIEEPLCRSYEEQNHFLNFEPPIRNRRNSWTEFTSKLSLRKDAPSKNLSPQATRSSRNPSYPMLQ